MEKSAWKRLLIMLVLLLLLMYAIMLLNVDEASHIYINMTRFYMSVLMICAMAVLMPMKYADKRKNAIIVVSSIVMFLLAFVGIHKQIGISHIQYMRSTIPHHSVAMMTSENAYIKEARVRKLPGGIINTQKKEVAEIKEMTERLKKAK